MRIGAVSSFAAKGLNPTPAPPIPSYQQTVQNISGLVAYWPCTEDSGTTLADIIGGINATITGTPTFNASDLAPNSAGGAIDFPGNGAAASAPHDADLLLGAFTLSFWTKLHSIPTDPDFAMPLVSKDASAANTDGDFVVYLPQESAGRVRVRFRDGVTTLDLDSAENAIRVETAHHVLVTADNTGFTLDVDGVFHGKNTNYTDAWSLNVAPVLLASNPHFSGVGNMVLQHVAIYNRVLTQTEKLLLAQRTDPPIANDDGATVPESATTAINVLANDSYVGTPTLSIVAQPGGGDSVAVNGALINYTAGAVTANTVRSFQYRITDPNGQSNTATVGVTVEDSGFTPTTNANCYPTTSPDTVVVNSMADLDAAIDAAPPGRHILVAAGTYAGGTRTFNPGGTEANPIVVKPQGARGSVTIDNAIWTLAAGSARLVFANLYFNNPQFSINGQHHRVTRCRVRQIGGNCFRVVAATDTRIDHCDVAEYTSGTGQKSFVELENANVGNGSCQRVLIDYNYCHDVDPAVGDNGQDFIGLHASGAGADEAFPGLIIDHNLFTNITLPSEGELIGAKCSGIVFRFNTVLNTSVGPCYINAPRQAEAFEARSNWFENTRNPVIMIRSDDPLVIGNRFIGALDLFICTGDSYWGAHAQGDYPAARGGRIIGNRMGTGHIRVGDTEFGSAAADALNNNVVISGGGANTRDGGGDPYVLVAGGHTGTTFNADGEAFVAAVKIATPALAVGDAVGMFAADPLCPSGPQS